MPRYDFECECGVVLTKTFSMKDVPQTIVCDFCGGPAYRVFSAPQVNVNSLYSAANKRGLAEMDANAPVEEKAYNKRFDRRMQSL